VSDDAFDVGAPEPGVPITAIPATIAILATAVAIPAAVLALLGASLMIVGVRRGNRRLHTMGAAASFAGVLFATALGAAPALALLGGACAVLAWDAGEHAIGLGQQVGRDADARRAVLVHTGASSLAAIGIVLLTTVVYLLARTGQPSTAAGVLVAAVGLFALLLHR